MWAAHTYPYLITLLAVSYTYAHTCEYELVTSTDMQICCNIHIKRIMIINRGRIFSIWKNNNNTRNNINKQNPDFCDVPLFGFSHMFKSLYFDTLPLILKLGMDDLLYLFAVLED